jgi:hypothetical protein
MTATQNFFSILGDESGPTNETKVERNFFIQHAYLDCSGDRGWLVAISGNEDICPWAHLGADYIRLKYSKLPTMANWNDNGKQPLLDSTAFNDSYLKWTSVSTAEYADAHVMAVFLR